MKAKKRPNAAPLPAGPKIPCQRPNGFKGQIGHFVNADGTRKAIEKFHKHLTEK